MTHAAAWCYRRVGAAISRGHKSALPPVQRRPVAASPAGQLPRPAAPAGADRRSERVLCSLWRWMHPGGHRAAGCARGGASPGVACGVRVNACCSQRSTMSTVSCVIEGAAPQPPGAHCRQFPPSKHEQLLWIKCGVYSNTHPSPSSMLPASCASHRPSISGKIGSPRPPGGLWSIATQHHRPPPSHVIAGRSRQSFYAPLNLQLTECKQ